MVRFQHQEMKNLYLKTNMDIIEKTREQLWFDQIERINLSLVDLDNAELKQFDWILLRDIDRKLTKINFLIWDIQKKIDNII